MCLVVNTGLRGFNHPLLNLALYTGVLRMITVRQRVARVRVTHTHGRYKNKNYRYSYSTTVTYDTKRARWPLVRWRRRRETGLGGGGGNSRLVGGSLLTERRSPTVVYYPFVVAYRPVSIRRPVIVARFTPVRLRFCLGLQAFYGVLLLLFFSAPSDNSFVWVLSLIL